MAACLLFSISINIQRVFCWCVKLGEHYRSERWAGISNFELYCTSDYVSFLDLVAEALEAVPTAEIPVYAQSELDNAVLEAEKLTATSSKSEVMAAIEVLNAAIAKANELITPYAGLKSTILDIKEFKMAESLVTSAEDFYFTTDDVTAQDLISAEDALFKSFVEFMTENYLSEDESFLVNPNISETNDPSISNQSIPDGWDIIMSGSGNNNFINRGEHYDGNTANIYLDAWHGTAGNLSYDASQTVNELPTALYILTAAARTNGEGVEIYANNRASDVINNGGSDGELGNGWNTITVPVIVKDGTLKVGVRTNKAKNWNGTWLGADDFAAKSIKTDATPTSISEAVSESSVLVYVVNNKVVVSGADKYSVITVDGKVIAPKAELSKGIYYVIVEGKAYPVAVK